VQFLQRIKLAKRYATERATRDSYADSRLLAAGQRGNDIVNVMLVIVIAATVGYVGIKATSETRGSTFDTNPTTIDAGNRTAFENASTSLTGGFAGAMDLTEVVFIVLMLGIIITVLVGLRGRR